MERAVMEELVRAARVLSKVDCRYVDNEVRFTFPSHREAFYAITCMRLALGAAEVELDSLSTWEGET